MILNKTGERYIYDGITYKVGSEVFVVDEGPYEGLIGKITEIRDGEDRETDNETDNETVDIYCDFDLPAIRCECDRLAGRFSILYGQPMALDEINLEQVIMAPEMIQSLENEHKDTTIHVLTEEWCSDNGYGRDILVYTDPRKAKAKMQQLIRDDKHDGSMSEWMHQDDFVEEFDGRKYSAWLDNDYEGYHYNLEMHELAIDRTMCDQNDSNM